MRRLIAVLINFGVCISFTIIFRLLIALPHRIVMSLERPIMLHSSWNVLPWYIFMIPVIVNCVIYFCTERYFNNITLGERVTGIRVITKKNIWLAIFDLAVVFFYPITIMYVWLTGKMPYDQLLSIEVKFVKKPPLFYINKRCRLFSFLLGSIGVVYLLFQIKNDNHLILYYSLWPITGLIETNYIAGIYTSCIELESSYLGEIRLHEKIKEEKEKDIFSTEGEKRAWAFVVLNEEQYTELYRNYEMNLNGFDFSKNVLIVTYGRKLKEVRILDKPDPFMSGNEPLSGHVFAYRHLELENSYKKDSVYFYKVPKIDLYELTNEDNFMTEEDDLSYQNVLSVGTDYNLYKAVPASAQLSVIGEGGVFNRWVWAYHWVY